LPYEKVSAESIEWLKKKGWWPLKVAFQADALVFMMDLYGLLDSRGVEVEAVPFLAGPPMMEAFVAGQIQAMNIGNFPFTSLIDKKVPVAAISHLAQCVRTDTIVPKDSPLTKLTDLKAEKLGRQGIIAVPVGTSGEWYIRNTCKHQGLEIGKDVVLKDMSVAEIMSFPKGIDAFVSWSLFVTHPVVTLGTARILEEGWPYVIYLGYLCVPRELVDEVPDVVQAMADAYLEANLIMRQDFKEVSDFLRVRHPIVKLLPPETTEPETAANYLYQPPTWQLIIPDFEVKELAAVAPLLYEAGRTKRLITEADYKAHFHPEFQTNTFKKLGWAIPKLPPYIPKDWRGEVGKYPYPPYYYSPLPEYPGQIVEPRPFPEPGDLVKPWYFNGKLYSP
jgi:sulfonate transport system substrate-binding protein